MSNPLRKIEVGLWNVDEDRECSFAGYSRVLVSHPLPDTARFQEVPPGTPPFTARAVVFVDGTPSVVASAEFCLYGHTVFELTDLAHALLVGGALAEQRVCDERAAEQRVREECAAKLDALADLVDSDGDDAREHRSSRDCLAPQYLEGVADQSEHDAQRLRALAKAWREGGAP